MAIFSKYLDEVVFDDSAGSYTAGRPLEDADSRTIFVSNVSTDMHQAVAWKEYLLLYPDHIFIAVFTGSFCCDKGQSVTAF
jgi:hypothetical protein